MWNIFFFYILLEISFANVLKTNDSISLTNNHTTIQMTTTALDIINTPKSESYLDEDNYSQKNFDDYNLSLSSSLLPPLPTLSFSSESFLLSTESFVNNVNLTNQELSMPSTPIPVPVKITNNSIYITELTQGITEIPIIKEKLYKSNLTLTSSSNNRKYSNGSNNVSDFFYFTSTPNSTSINKTINYKNKKTLSMKKASTEFNFIDRVLINLENITYPETTNTKNGSQYNCCEDYEKYVVSLRRANPLDSDLFIHVCIAILLTKDIVLCPAHCFYDKRGRFIDDPDYYRIVVGKGIKSPFTNGIIVTEIIQHPEYLPYLRKNDIGLVKLDYQMPSSLVPMLDNVNYEQVTNKDNCSQIFFTSKVLGYDALQEGYTISVYKAEIIHWIICMKLYEKWGIFVGRNQICAKKQVDCSADDGSVLMCNNKLVGMLSFRNDERGFKFYSDILPDVFTATSKYEYFLRTTINEMNDGSSSTVILTPTSSLLMLLSSSSSLFLLPLLVLLKTLNIIFL